MTDSLTSEFLFIPGQFSNTVCRPSRRAPHQLPVPRLRVCVETAIARTDPLVVPRATGIAMRAVVHALEQYGRTQTDVLRLFIFPNHHHHHLGNQSYSTRCSTHAVLLLASHWPGKGERSVALVRHACGGCRFFTGARARPDRRPPRPR
jgi:hypothetical protein